MKIISVRENPEYKEKAVRFFQQNWVTVSPIMYEDSINAENPLPQWYLLQKEDEIIGCAGLITDDFISRMDLYPWKSYTYLPFMSVIMRNLGSSISDRGITLGMRNQGYIR